MKSLTRDITLTLVIKIILLVLLWWVCVRPVVRPTHDTRQWFLGEKYNKILSVTK